ncbi:MAG: oxidoreductase [Ferruginibacter sp.]
MMKKTTLVLLFLVLLNNVLSAQSVKLLTSGTKTSMRGLSVVDDKTVWVSGSNGMVGLSVDSGNTWKWITVKGYEKTEFRDIEAFDAKTAIIMGIDSPAYILKSIDAGENWKVVFEDHTSGIFLDAMEFWNDQSGIFIGDPIKNRFVIGRTFDGGKNWRSIPDVNRPVADSGEACFASSGTNVRKLNKGEAIFISGGMSSHLFIRDKKIKLPIIQGTASTGANSIAIKNSNMMMVVGGDFNTKDSSFKNCFITNDAGLTWNAPTIPPHGYRSCIEWLKKTNWVSCGLNGVDYTTDDGKTFTWISKDGYHVCRKAKKGNTVYFAGGGGRIGKLILD